MHGIATPLSWGARPKDSEFEPGQAKDSWHRDYTQTAEGDKGKNKETPLPEEPTPRYSFNTGSSSSWRPFRRLGAKKNSTAGLSKQIGPMGWTRNDNIRDDNVPESSHWNNRDNPPHFAQTPAPSGNPLNPPPANPPLSGGGGGGRGGTGPPAPPADYRRGGDAPPPIPLPANNPPPGGGSGGGGGGGGGPPNFPQHFNPMPYPGLQGPPGPPGPPEPPGPPNGGGGGPPVPPNAPAPAYGTMIPSIKAELKPDQLPLWDGNHDTAIHYFWKIQQLASLGGYVPAALGYWLWNNLVEGSPVQEWFASLTHEEQARMRQHYLTYLRGIHNNYLGDTWQWNMNSLYESQYFRQPGFKRESPPAFITRCVKYM
jgi:hypothetical protein